ncbi:MAG: ADP-ribosylglycohydrolase family protein, partial [Gammaproteobacteria bacterium]|nr:ADP-ribosylglycohydrolase family protein [Gammaproteobacteria bacterium]
HRGAVLGVLLGLINGATDEDKFGRIANSSALQEDIAQLIDV